MTRFLTPTHSAGSVIQDEAEDSSSRIVNIQNDLFNDLRLAEDSRRREASLAAHMPSQAAVLLPLVLSLARLQARRDNEERRA